ncbi:Mitochondrial fission factor [Aphelenchoides bicaudatus]|nr:Mitochondrial fission factor [Aphelenchoides bicaudatus]
MEVPDHLYYAGRQNAGRSDSFSKRSKNERNSLVDEMFVPDKITVGAGNVLIPHHHQPNDILRDKPNLTSNSQVTLMPTKLTANEFPLQDTKQDKQIAEEAKKRADSQDSLLKNADSMNGLNNSLAVDIDPIRELKSVRRAMGRLATRVLELEDENNRRQTREYGLWAIFTGSLAFLAFIIFKK